MTRCIFYLTPDMTLYDRQRLGTWGPRQRGQIVVMHGATELLENLNWNL